MADTGFSINPYNSTWNSAQWSSWGIPTGRKLFTSPPPLNRSEHSSWFTTFNPGSVWQPDGVYTYTRPDFATSADITEMRAAAIANNQPLYGKITPTTEYTLPALDENSIVYNVGMPIEAYFPMNRKNGKTYRDELQMHTNNQPTIVNNPKELWNRDGGHKGMLLIHVEDGFQTTFDGNMASAFSNDTALRYGFQFHYNPETIAMAYAGVPNTDVNLESTGQEKFNLVGANTTQSTIGVNVRLSRQFDFKYYTEEGTLRPEVPKNLYAPRQPTIAEQKDIYNKGTMYDVEFLLGALLGFKLPTALRATTADVGYIAARRTELHLGKSLRYMGYVSSFQLNHMLFDERMVPIQSNLLISFNRIPDYPRS